MAKSNGYEVEEESKEELYRDVYITLLIPYIQEAIDNYYGKIEGKCPVVAPYLVDVLSVVRPDGYGTFNFIIKFKITPYIDAHNAIGLDYVTISIKSGGTKVIKFEHIESYTH